MFFGRNPFERIRENKLNPGHFREYTRRELVEYAANSGFIVRKEIAGNYFDFRFLHSAETLKYSPQRRVLNWMYAIVPSSAKPGITLILEKAAGTSDTVIPT
jgi:hypothetical protein